jgi:homoserine O-acetyltransferase
VHRLHGSFALESGLRLDDAQVAYRTWGRLSPSGDNAVLVCHALTGSADVERWWDPLLGAGRALDPERDFVVCSNVLGGCYGTTGPASGPRGAVNGGPAFPEITVRDIVRLQAVLLDALGVRRLALVIGGSLGGMQALEWGAMFPERVDAAAVIAASGRHSPWCIAFSEAQRRAIALDPVHGLAVARAIAMISYRSAASFGSRFGRSERRPGEYEVESWLRHHGDEILRRFDPQTYVTLTRAMDTHDLARGRGGYEDVLAAIDVPALVVGITSDVLYPPAEQEELARLLPHADLALLDSPHGHDAFLIDGDAVNERVVAFRGRTRRIDEHRRRRTCQA